MADDLNWPADPGPGGYETGTPAGDNTPPPSAAAPASPTAGANGHPPAPDNGGAPGAPSADDASRRFDELNSRFTTLEQRFSTAEQERDYWRRIANAAMGRENPAAPPSPEDERRARIRNTILEIVPELRDLQGLRDGRQADEQERTRQSDAFAARAIGNALDHVARTILGEGKTGKDLSPSQQGKLQRAYIDWVLEDKGRRTAFDLGEMPDPAKFWEEYNRDLIALGVRATNADVERRAGRIAALPSGGPSQAPVGTPPPDLDYKDETAVHKAAYAAAIAGR